MIGRDLIATCWTSAGNAGPLIGDEVSTFPLRERIETAARLGWEGFGIVHADLLRAKETTGLGEVRRMLDDSGMRHVEVEFLGDWWTTGERRQRADRQRAELFEAAAVLGAATIKAGTEIDGEITDLPAFLDAFDQVASEAGAVGTRIALEPLPMSAVRTLEAGIEIVETVANPHGGLAVDVWHVHRGGTSYANMRRLLPLGRIFQVELDDARPDLVGSLWDDTINERLLPGAGIFDVPAFVRTLVEIGWNGPWGVEIISSAHRALPLEQALADARHAALAMIDAAAAA